MKKEKLVRKHKISIALNEKEYKVLNNYIKKYRIKNKAEFIRKITFTYILKEFDKDYPSVFSNDDFNN